MRIPIPSHPRLVGAVVVVLILIRFSAAQPSAAQGPPRWVAQPSLKQRLREPIGGVGLSWSETPLREALTALSRSKRVAVLLDRRVDPGQELALTVGNESLDSVLHKIAADRGLGVCVLDAVVYFGPLRHTSRLRTVAALRRGEVGRLPAEARRRWLAAKALRWDDFATPRDVLAAMASSGGIKIHGLERVPHDLWAAADLPPLGLADRLTLVLGQFDLTFQVSLDGKAISLIPVPEKVALTRSYPGGRQAQTVADRWRKLAPDSQIEVVGEKIQVAGLLEDHERIAAPARPVEKTAPQSQPTPIDRVRIDSLSVQNQPLGSVLELLGRKLGLDVRIDREAVKQAGISMDRLVSFEVKKATVDELFEKILNSTGLTFQRQDRTVRISPAR